MYSLFQRIYVITVVLLCIGLNSVYADDENNNANNSNVNKSPGRTLKDTAKDALNSFIETSVKSISDNMTSPLKPNNNSPPQQGTDATLKSGNEPELNEIDNRRSKKRLID